MVVGPPYVRVGIGNVFSSLIHSVARNPSLAKQSFGYAILGFALTEAIRSFTPMMALLISSIPYNLLAQNQYLALRSKSHIYGTRVASTRENIPKIRGHDADGLRPATATAYVLVTIWDLDYLPSLLWCPSMLFYFVRLRLSHVNILY
ncbi:hypothetical protein DVH24_038917 [Malus domestica]|uniref:ATP synthase subunit 9, mitochondrial n=1 Tax=Malus domestica TaxID=3750 RepID=A0A498KGN4_MALDO|nr:hypothetical protein DVH24_038917 [Malus domestica]